MTADEEKRVDALFAKGDPGARVTEHLPGRVAARLAQRARPALALGWGRAVAVGLVLASSAGLGAAAVYVTSGARSAPVAGPRGAPARPQARPADPLALEAGLLRAALEALQRGDAPLALARLDERQRRFPSGALQTEAHVARARALLAAGRTDEALAEFEVLPPAELTAALKLTWAQALVGAGRCARALELLEGIDGSDEARLAASLRARCGR